MTTQQHDIRSFFERWAVSFDEMSDAYRDLLGPSATWVAGPPPIPVTHGGDQAVGLLEGFRNSHDLTTIDVDILHLGHSGDMVYSERVDHLVDSESRRFVSLPVAGVMRFDEHGQLTYWRDYWDMREFLELPQRPSPIA